MITDVPVAIHIGLMKTGTTTLQGHVFPRCPGLAYFGKPGAALARPIRAVTTLDEALWTRARPAVVDAFREGLAGAGPRVLISEEELSVGGEIDSAADRAMIARRLHGLFPDATIVVVVRNQLTAIQSLYGYVIGRGPEVVPFGRWLEQHHARTVPGRGLDVFDYAALVSLYVELFSAERVKVLLYEDMVARYPRFLADLAVAIGLPPDAMAHIDNQRHNVRPPGLDTAYTPDHRALVSERFAHSNAWLSEFLRTDLRALEYPCP